MHRGLIGFCGAVVIVLSSFTFQAAAGVYDIPDIKACEIVTGEEVAQFAGGKILVNPGSTSYFCNYVVEIAGGTVENYQLAFDSPSTSQLMLEHISGEQKGEMVPGLLDETFLGKSAMGDQFELRALRRDKFGMNVSGDRKDVVLKIAQLAVTRLP